MGYPVGLTQLLQIVERQQDHIMDGDLLRAVKRYRIFAFILHDKLRHREFDRELAEQFEVLDVTTGKWLMFLALVDPPQEWIQRAERRPYYQALEAEKVLASMSSPSVAHQTRHPEITTRVLGNGLNLEIDQPTVVITDNLNSTNFYYFHTDAHSLARQFGELTYISNLMEKGFTQEVLTRLADRINLHIGKPKYLRSVNEAILDTLNLVDIGQKWNYQPGEKQIALHRARMFLSAAMQELKNAKDSSDSSDEDDIYVSKLAIEVGASIALMDQRGGPSRPETEIRIPMELLEPESQVFYNTSRSLSKIFLETDTVTIKNLTKNLDTSPAVITISKIFEVELNLSLGHWIRQQLNVSLPDYFNLHQPNTQAVIGETDFNRLDREHQGAWLPPAIGQTQIAFSKLTRKWDRLPATKEEITLLVEKWNQIRLNRNLAAHTGILNSNDMQNSINLINSLSDANWFMKMAQLKWTFRGDLL